MFQVTTLNLKNIPLNDDGEIDFKKDFFGKPANLAVTGQLEGELAKTRTELETQQSVLQPGAHQLVLLQNKINSLERQIGLEKQRLVDDTGGGLNVSAASFEAVAFEKEFAEERYATALRFLELSRVEALQQGRYLSVLSPPSLPDEPAYPRRYFGVLTVFAVAFAVFSVGGITLAVIREHARI